MFSGFSGSILILNIGGREYDLSEIHTYFLEAVFRCLDTHMDI